MIYYLSMDYNITPDHLVKTPEGFKKISDLFPLAEGSVFITVTDEELKFRNVLLTETKNLE